MNLLITGGSGLIGRALINKLHVTHQITVLSRRPATTQRSMPVGVQTIGSLQELADLNKFSAVINLAGEPIADKRWSNKQKTKIEQSRWDTTEQLVKLFAASSERPHVFISGSAIGYYGRQGNTIVTEANNQPNDEFTHRLCKHWEDLALQAEHQDTRVCLLRTGIVLAPNGGALPRMSLPFKFGLGGPIGDGEQMMSWIQLEDMVNLIIFLLENQQCSGAYNATAPNPVSNKVFSKTLGEVLKRPVIFKVPAFSMRLLFGEMADMLLTGQAVLPERLQQAGFEFTYPELKQALAKSF